MLNKIHSLLDKLVLNYRTYGLRGVISFVIWIIRTGLEKAVIRLEDIFHVWQFRYSIKASLKAFINRKKRGNIDEAPLVSFLIPVKEFSSSLLETIHSLDRQQNPSWECLILHECELSAIPQIKEHQWIDERIRFIRISSSEDRDGLLKKVLRSVNSTWMVMTHPGDKQEPDLVDHISRQSGDIVYWDEDHSSHFLDPTPFYKPDWSPELWLSVDILRCSAYAVAHLRGSHKRNPNDRLIAAGVFHAKGIIHIPTVLTHCQHPAWNGKSPLQNHLRDVKNYLSLRGISEPSILLDLGNHINVSWSIKSEKVSIIIPNKNNYPLLDNCLSSIFNKTNYADYEIVIVDDQSTEKSILDFYSRITKEKRNIRIISTKSAFNYSRACNLGAQNSSGKYLLFLNNDTEVVTPNWLESLVQFAGLSEIAIVGAELLYPDGRIQHAGIVLGLEGHASHVLLGADEKIITPYGLSSWYRNCSAVTGACMLIRKEVYQELNGFDEKFELIFSDVDLCLRALKKGYRIVYDPDAKLIHHEGRSRGRINPKGDIELGYEKFIEYINRGDPYYNKNLSRAWRIPTLRREWEQSPGDRVKKIVKYHWY